MRNADLGNELAGRAGVSDSRNNGITELRIHGGSYSRLSIVPYLHQTEEGLKPDLKPSN